MTKEECEIETSKAIMEMRNHIEELEEKISILLSCKNCPENKGGLLCQKEYEDKCLAQKIQYIKELKEENEELNDKLNNLSKVAEVRLANWQKYEQENAELKERADKADLDSVTFFNQLCKAKEIIKDFLSLGIFGIFKGTTAEEIVDKAENFLKEDK